ncbi:cell division protein FtsK [Rhizomonospora bruguierae]|uniref:cell division protein FtsK n=1 Tax=Rhizomonospora bruguierae TaxID=1581705 RepID=UPI001BCAB6EC|nr:cell division protein FtsK [Micromonospora sp. NBRC 107566]
MTTPHDDEFDWDRREAEILNLDEARNRRDATTPDPDTTPLANSDGTVTSADGLPLAAPSGHPDTSVMVDSPAAQRRPRFTLAGVKDGTRRPIIPDSIRSRTQVTSNAAWLAGYVAHAAGFHAVRLPLYAGKAVWRAPRGFARVAGGFVRWLFDLEGEPVRQATVRTEDADAYLKLSRQRDRRVRWRGLVGAAVAAVVVLAVVGWLLSPAWARWAALAALLAVLGVAGAPQDRPLLDTAVVRSGVTPLTSDQVIRALSALRIVGIDRAIRAGDTGRNWFPAPITRDGPGWRADVELPRGVTAAEVVEKREELASALTRPLGCVWPEANAAVHPGRLVLFVADKDMSAMKQPPWPLLKAGKVDLFTPFAFGTDPRGSVVTITLMFASMVIGSIPRMGKTFALRLALLAGALDPRAELHVYDLKGTGDLAPLEPVAYRYRAGDDDEDMAYSVAAMREVRAEMRRRTKVIRDLPRDVCPENKVTPELASRKSLGLHPIVIGVDECQIWFEHPNHGAELEEICTDLVKRGPALGIELLLGTQRPDAKSIPPNISKNAVLRFCLKVLGWRENDMVLGDGMHGAGIKATMFSRRDSGIGYLAGDGDDPVIARTFYVDGPTADAVVKRARALRDKAGTVTGHAAGQTIDTAAARRDTLLDDIAAVMPDSEPKLWTDIVCERLAAVRPDVYAGLTREQLTAALKPWGVATGQVWGTDPATGNGANRRGIDRQHILDAITVRDRKGGGKAAG